MDIKNQAIAKITEECEGKDYLIPFEEHLTRICTTDEIANKILAPGKTLKGAFEKMRGIAKGRAKNGFAYISEEEGYEIIRDYYEIDLSDKAEEDVAPIPDNVIDIMDLI